MPDRARKVVEQRLHLTGQQVGERGGGAAIGHVDDVDAGHHLEQFARAETFLTTAANHGPQYQRNNALYTARIALAHLGQANVVDAAAAGERALDMLSEDISSDRIAQTLGRVDNGLTSYGNVRAVNSFRDRLYDLKRRSAAGRHS